MGVDLSALLRGGSGNFTLEEKLSNHSISYTRQASSESMDRKCLTSYSSLAIMNGCESLSSPKSGEV